MSVVGFEQSNYTFSRSEDMQDVCVLVVTPKTDTLFQLEVILNVHIVNETAGTYFK